jgi:hypothetical protein
MIWEKDTWQHYIHYRSMIGDNNVSLVFVNFFTRFIDKPVPEAHTVEHSNCPKTDKKVA